MANPASPRREQSTLMESTTAAPSQADKTCYLLRIPPEMRLMIFEHLISDAKPPPAHTIDILDLHLYIPDNNITRINKQLRHESLPAFKVAMQDFENSTTGSTFTLSINEHITYPGYRNFVLTCADAIPICTLRSLTIKFDGIVIASGSQPYNLALVAISRSKGGIKWGLNFQIQPYHRYWNYTSDARAELLGKRLEHEADSQSLELTVAGTERLNVRDCVKVVCKWIETEKQKAPSSSLSEIIIKSWSLTA